MKVGSLEADLILNTQKYKQGIAQAVSDAKSTSQQIASALNSGPLQSAKSVGGALSSGLVDAGKQAQLTRRQIQTSLAGPVSVSLNHVRNQAKLTGAEIKRSLGGSFTGSARVVDKYARSQQNLQRTMQQTKRDAESLGRQFVTSVVDKLIQTSNQAKQTGKSLSQLSDHTSKSTANVSTQAKEIYERLKIANELATMSGHSVVDVSPEDTAFLKKGSGTQDEAKTRSAKEATKAVKENAVASEAAADKKTKAAKKEKKAADETTKAAAKTVKTQKQVSEQSRQAADMQEKTTKKKQEAIRNEQQAAASAEDTARKTRSAASQQKAASAEVARASEESIKAAKAKAITTTQTQQAVERAIASEIHLRRKAQEQLGGQPLAAPTEAPKAQLPVPVKSALPAIPFDFKKVARQTTQQLEPIVAAAQQVGTVSKASVVDPIRSSLGTIQLAASKARQELQSVEAQAKKTGAATTKALSSVAQRSSAVNELQQATGTTGGGGGNGGSGGGKGTKPPTGGGGAGGGDDGDDGSTSRKAQETARAASTAAEKVKASSAGTKSRVKSDIDEVASEAKKKSSEVASEAEKASKRAQNATWALRGSIKDVGKVVSGIIIAQGFYRSLDIIKQATGSIVDYRRELDSANVAFSTMLGNAEEGKQYVVAMQQFALQTPGFTLQETETAARRLLAMGFQAESSLSVLQDIVDMAAIKKDPTSIDRITLALGQVRTAGRLYGQELRQLTEAGVPVDTLQKKLGLSSEQMHNLGKNAVPASKAIDAILSTIHERFGGAAKALSTTTAGLEEMAKERALQLGNQLFDAPLQAYKRMLQGLVQTLGKLSSAMSKGGMHGFFNALVGPKMAGSVMAIATSFMRLGNTIKNLWKALKPFLEGMSESITRVLGLVLPVITGITQAVSWLIRKLVEANPAIVGVISRLMGLFVVTLVGAGIMLLCQALVTFTTTLWGTIKGLQAFATVFTWASVLLKRNPWVMLVTVVIGALFALASSCKYVGDWLDWLSDKLASVGVQISNKGSSVLDPSKASEALNKYMKELQDTMKAEDGVGDAADKAGKKIKDMFVASFDEVFQIPEKMDSAAGAIGDIELPETPDITVKPNTKYGDDKDKKKPKDPKDPNLWFKKTEPGDNKPKGDKPGQDSWRGGPPAVLIKGLEELIILFKLYEAAMQKLHGWSVSLSESWGKLGESASKLRNSVSDWFSNALDKASQSISGMKQGLGQAWQNAWDSLESVSVIINKKLDGASDAAFEWGHGIGVSLNNALDSVLAGAHSISGWFGKQWDTVAQSVSSNLAPIGGAIVAFFLGIPGRLKQGLTNIKDAIVGNWKEILTGIGLVLAGIALAVVVWIGAIPASIAAGCAAIVLAVVGIFVQAKVAAAAELDNTKKEVGTKWDSIRTTISDKCNAILDDVKRSFNNMKMETTNTVTGWVTDISNRFNTLKTNLSNTANTIKTTVGGAFSGLATSVGNAWSGIGRTVKSHINGIIDSINGLIRKMNNIKFSFPKKTIMGQEIGGWSISPLQVPTIPHLAKGGIITKESLFVGGEGNRREGVIPLTGSGAKMVAQALASEIAASLQATGTDDRPILYVGTLVADDRSLTELERRMKVIRLKESNRVVGGGL